MTTLEEMHEMVDKLTFILNGPPLERAQELKERINTLETIEKSVKIYTNYSYTEKDGEKVRHAFPHRHMCDSVYDKPCNCGYTILKEYENNESN